MDGSSTFNDSTIPPVFPSNEVLVLSNNGRVVFVASGIVVDWSALNLTRDVAVEDTQTITSIRVSNIVTEFTQLLVLRADISIKGWSDGRGLEIIPVGIPV